MSEQIQIAEVPCYKIGMSVRKWRNLKGKKQSTLANEIHLSAASLSNIENDLTIPNLKQIHDIAVSLEITIEMLLCGPKIIER